MSLNIAILSSLKCSSIHKVQEEKRLTLYVEIYLTVERIFFYNDRCQFWIPKSAPIDYKKLSTWLQGVNKGLLKWSDAFE